MRDTRALRDPGLQPGAGEAASAGAGPVRGPARPRGGQRPQSPLGLSALERRHGRGCCDCSGPCPQPEARDGASPAGPGRAGAAGRAPSPSCGAGRAPAAGEARGAVPICSLSHPLGKRQALDGSCALASRLLARFTPLQWHRSTSRARAALTHTPPLLSGCDTLPHGDGGWPF